MFNLNPLTPEHIRICQKTISPLALLLLCGDAIRTSKRMSVVRMADGENHLLRECLDGNPSDPVAGFNDPAWAKRYGIADMTVGELKSRLLEAGRDCTHFAPSISGMEYPNYKLHHFFPERDFYVDNFYTDQWNEEQVCDLFRAAGHVLMIIRNVHTADAMQNRAKWFLGVRVTWIPMDKWQDADTVVEKANRTNAKLVLFSAGPAGKHIGPRIANGGSPKVVLDVGHAMDHFCLAKTFGGRKYAWTEENASIRPIFERNWAEAVWPGK